MIILFSFVIFLLASFCSYGLFSLAWEELKNGDSSRATVLGLIALAIMLTILVLWIKIF